MSSGDGFPSNIVSIVIRLPHLADLVVGLQNLIVNVRLSTSPIKFLVRLELGSNLKVLSNYIWPIKINSKNSGNGIFCNLQKQKAHLHGFLYHAAGDVDQIRWKYPLQAITIVTINSAVTVM